MAAAAAAVLSTSPRGLGGGRADGAASPAPLLPLASADLERGLLEATGALDGSSLASAASSITAASPPVASSPLQQAVATDFIGRTHDLQPPAPLALLIQQAEAEQARHQQQEEQAEYHQQQQQEEQAEYHQQQQQEEQEGGEAADVCPPAAASQPPTAPGPAVPAPASMQGKEAAHASGEPRDAEVAALLDELGWALRALRSRRGELRAAAAAPDGCRHAAERNASLPVAS
jgi:hypothetical protein